MRVQRLRLSPPVAYIASVLADKGFSLIAIPVMAHHMTPSDYGRLDVAVSLIEFAGLVLSFGMGGTLMRFATIGDEVESRRWGAELMASALALALVAGLALQAALPAIAAALDITISMTALRWGVLGATLTALIELPLVWLRVRGRVEYYLLFVTGRSLVQVLLTWSVLVAGWGAEGVLISNGVVLLVLATLMTAQQITGTGLAFSLRALDRIGSYGLPLVGGALAMFALGSFNRWFLSGSVPDQEIAYLALATKLALAAPILLQPFLLWWLPRRIAALERPGGLEESAWAFGIGYSVLIVSALGVSLAGPSFIVLALPHSYAGAMAYLPFVVLVFFLNELNTLCSTGAHARQTGYAVLAASVSGAVAAVAGYALLTPSFGVAGAIAAMIAGHLVRLAIFIWTGHAIAPIRYPVVSATLVLTLAAASVWFAPDPGELGIRAGWSVVALAAVSAFLIASGLLRIPGSLMPASLRRFSRALST